MKPYLTVLRRRFDQALPVIVAAMLILVGYATVSTYSEAKANARQDHQRIIDQGKAAASQKALLSCVDQVLTTLTGNLPPVREATVARDTAVVAAFVAIRDSLEHLSTSGADGTQIQALLTALDTVVKTSQHLSQVRADNPYPPPPSTYC